MSLLGTPLLVALGLVALAMPAVTLLAWPRTRGPRWAHVAQHAGLVVAAQVSALALSFVALNDYGQFFTSWSELFGTGQPAQVVATSHFGAASTGPVVRGRSMDVHAGRSAHRATATYAAVRTARSAAPRLPGAYGIRATDWSPRSSWATRGAVVQLQITGPVTGLSEPALVYLPPSYFSGQRALPLAEVFTGYPGSTAALVDRLDYPSHLLAALRTGAARPMVLVMLRPSVTYPRDTECTNVPGGPQAFSYFASDVPAVVERAFGLNATGYAAIGDSTGGMCATKLAVVDPQRFSVAVSMSGYYHAITDFTTGNLYGGSQAVRNANDVMWRLTHLPMPRVSLLVGTSLTERGADGYASAQRLLQAVRAPMSADEIVLSHGGHNFWTWNLEIPRALAWMSAHLAR